MLVERGNEVVEFSGVSEEYFPFAIDGIFLQIEGNRLGRTEIFHGFGYGYPQTFAQSKEMVDRRACGEDDGGILG